MKMLILTVIEIIFKSDPRSFLFITVQHLTSPLSSDTLDYFPYSRDDQDEDEQIETGNEDSAVKD